MRALKKITIALAGNPNSGKTTIFNNLTGARQHVGNYPGVTIEKKEGTCTFRDVEIQVVDLPGAYSLSAFSPEELIARRYLLKTPPDVVVDILDASNLERNLYLAVQLLELNIPLILVCNMVDMVAARGATLDLQRLSEQFRCPVVATVGHKRQGTEPLLETVLATAGRQRTESVFPRYDGELEQSISRVQAELEKSPDSSRRPRWQAIRLLEEDAAVQVERDGIGARDVVKRESGRLAARYGETAETVVATQRYDFIGKVCESAIRQSSSAGRTASDKIDAIVTHRLLALPIFLAAMFAVFWATFNLSVIPMEWIEKGVAALGVAVSNLWPTGSGSPLKSLLVDGIIGGVGNVIVFLPNIFILFLAIGLLEDSGYMPRAAFIMDRLMHKIGLHGKSFIPLLLGFGCTVPAIMATRTLESRRDRLTAMLVAPLMSCGARLPIYSLLIPAFFPQRWQAPVLLSMYLTGIILAIGLSKLLRSTLFKGDVSPFVMELPPYRVPGLRDAFLHMWERSSLYLKKAGTVILGISVLLWALTNFPKPPAQAAVSQASISQAAISTAAAATAQPDQTASLTYSFAGRAGHLLAPVLAPMGFDWKIGTALIGAFAAKEVFVAQMSIIYAAGEGEGTEAPLREQLRRTYQPLVGFCIMLFCLIGSPCMTTIAVTRRESGAWRWAVLQFCGLTVLAYVVTALVFQSGRSLGLGA